MNSIGRFFPMGNGPYMVLGSPSRKVTVPHYPAVQCALRCWSQCLFVLFNTSRAQQCHNEDMRSFKLPWWKFKRYGMKTMLRGVMTSKKLKTLNNWTSKFLSWQSWLLYGFSTPKAFEIFTTFTVMVNNSSIKGYIRRLRRQLNFYALTALHKNM